MESRDPKSAPSFALDRLNDDEWEELTFLLAWGDDSRVERLKAPDGGLDTILPRPRRAREAERGWQAKHYPGAIRWNHCEESLDRAVELWKVEHVTFTFPRDLNRKERGIFAEKLESRHVGVVVDHWNGSAIRARLLAGEAGERVARRFFGPADPIEVIERAQRAGGQLSRGEHAIDREFAIDEFVQGADPHFHWVIHKALRSEPDPPQSPGAILRLMFGKGDLRMFVDAVPRTESSWEHYGPQVTVITDDSPAGEEARRLMRELFEGGGRLRLREGVTLSLERLPRPFGDALREELSGGELTVRAVPTPEPWFVRLQARSDLGAGELDIDLSPVEPSSEWDSEWHGERGGLEMAIRARWSVNENRGETAIALRYRPTPSPTEDRAAALGLLVALHGDGEMRLVDRVGSRTPLEQPLSARPLQTEVRELYRLADALAEIERFGGRSVPPLPDEIKLREVDGLHRVAETLRAGGEMYRIRDARLTGGSGMVSQIRRSGSDIETCEKASVRVFGEEVPIGERVMKLPLMTIREARRLGTGPADKWEVVLVPVHADEVEVWAEFRPPPSKENRGTGGW